MYLGKRKIGNKKSHEYWRGQCIEDKPGAVFIAITELEGLINTGRLASQYFKEGWNWMTERMNNSMCYDRHCAHFTEEEYRRLAEAMRDVARRLERHADEIDAARMPVWEKFPWEDWMDEEEGGDAE